MAWLSFARMFLMTAVFGVGTAWLFRGGLFLRAFGIEVVTNIGVPASRLRTLWRGLLAWSPVIIALGLLALNPILLPVRDAREVTFVIGVCAAAIFVVGAMWAVMHPERGLQDRVAGTYLVPR